MDTEKESFMVFERIGDDWSQESIPLTLNNAKEFMERLRKRHPENCYKILTVVA